jgi:hypothetical protein
VLRIVASADIDTDPFSPPLRYCGTLEGISVVSGMVPSFLDIDLCMLAVEMPQESQDGSLRNVVVSTTWKAGLCIFAIELLPYL